MKNWIGLMALMILMAQVGASHAQTNGGATNVALVANIALSGFKQTGVSNVTRVRITTKDIISAINASGHFNFSKTAQLIFLSIDDQLPSVLVRDGNGTNQITTDISDFFNLEEPAEIDGRHNFVSYAIRVFNFDDHNGTAFRVSGFVTLRRRRIDSPDIGPLIRVKRADTEVSGEGTVKGAAVVLHGMINAELEQATKLRHK
jgi:hypothetical protein